MTGNIQSSSSSRPAQNTQSYLSSAIPGEDRRAPQNTIDESVWETLSRDLRAVWEKMRQVLWPKYLLGGMLMQGGGGIEGGQGHVSDVLGTIRGFGRWPDADDVLQGSMSEGLRDWDLWYVFLWLRRLVRGSRANTSRRGPLLFSLLLSFLLAICPPPQ